MVSLFVNGGGHAAIVIFARRLADGLAYIKGAMHMKGGERIRAWDPMGMKSWAVMQPTWMGR